MNTQKTFHRDFLFLVGASVSWGTVGVVNRIIDAYSSTNALSLAFFRLLIAAVIFLLVSWRMFGLRLFRLKRRDFGVVVVMGGTQALYQACYSAAIPLAGVTISTLVALCAAPVIVALLSPLITREHLTPTILIALTGTLIGTVLLVATPNHANMASAEVSFFGIFLAFLAACGYALFVLCGRLISHSYHPLQINTLAFTIGALLLLFLSPSSGLKLAYPAWIWLLILYLGCIPTALAYGLFQIGIRSLTATMASIITLVEPLTAAILAWIVFREQLSLLGLFGAVLLLVSMGLILFPSKPS